MSKKCKLCLLFGWHLNSEAATDRGEEHCSFQQNRTGNAKKGLPAQCTTVSEKVNKRADVQGSRCFCCNGAGVDSDDELEGGFLSALGGSALGGEHWSHHSYCWIDPEFLQGVWRADQCFNIRYSRVRAIWRPWKSWTRQSSCYIWRSCWGWTSDAWVYIQGQQQSIELCGELAFTGMP